MKRKKLLTFLAILFSFVIVNGQNKENSIEPEDGIMINGVKWATRNVNMPGTFAANPEDAGLFYQWGSNVGWSSTDPLTATDGINTWRDFFEEGDTWLPAKNPCPDGWRVPTYAELQSLKTVTKECSNLNGVNGYFIGDGEPKLFLPAAGGRSNSDGSLYGTGVSWWSGSYWSSTQGRTGAYKLTFFYSGGFAPSYHYYRAVGFSVRCVAEN